MEENEKTEIDTREQAGSVASKATNSQESLDEKDDDLKSASLETSSLDVPTKHDASAQNFRPDLVDLGKVPGIPRGETESIRFDGEEEDPAVAVEFQRSSSPAAMQKTKGAAYEKVGEDEINRMHKFSLYETSSRFYLVGGDIMDQHYRVLKIDRTAPPGQLSIVEDDIVYNKREMNQLLNAIDDGNKGTGGMKLKCSTWGLLGFIRFTDAYYMLLITKRAQVALMGGHYIYQVDGTESVSLTTGRPQSRRPEEIRYHNILAGLDLTSSFYFSYSYDITRSLQQNIIRERTAINEGAQHPSPDFQDMFVWNHHLLKPAHNVLKNAYDWCHPIIHGYIKQESIDIFGRRVYLTLLARRSRFFAGARFLKRGANDLGYVANDVESEQIVSEDLTTSFHAPGPRLYANPSYTSYVQHRGSIPLHWTQDNTGVTPKPDIDLNLMDPFYSAAALHFDNLFERYGSPVHVINLIKARERMPRESKLLHEYKQAVDYLNQSLPKEKKIIYDAFDMARAAKTRGQDVIGALDHLAEKVLRKTGFFHNGDQDFEEPHVQNGVARTNCIDCLDRTNAAQFVIGKRALGRQLQALGVIPNNTVEYDTDCVDTFTKMFHGHGDAIAIQYGGSHLVNTMSTYRKINQWQNSSRDMVESFKRYYHNSFLDNQRQEAYNLFLGNYIYTQGQPMLWDLTTDYYLHHQNPRTLVNNCRRSYIFWYTPANLEPRVLPAASSPCKKMLQTTQKGVSLHDDYWLEYYRPLSISSFAKIFSFRLAQASKDRDYSYPSRKDEPSPFVVRKKQQNYDSPAKGAKKSQRKGVTIVDPLNEKDSLQGSIIDRRRKDMHLSIPEVGSPVKQSILRDPHFEMSMSSSAPPVVGAFPSLSNSASTGTSMLSSFKKNFKPADKSLINQWTLAQFHENSLNPSVSSAEEEEYAHYIQHPLNFPLVVSSETPSADNPNALEFYEYLSMNEGGFQAENNADDAASIRPATADAQRFDADAASIRSWNSRPASAAGASINIPFSHAPPSYVHSHPSYHHLHSNQLHPSHQPHHHHQPHHYHSLHSLHSHHQQHQLHPPQQYEFDPPPTATTNATNSAGLGKFQTAEEDIDEFEEFLKVRDNPLDVEEEDGGKKRYKAYKQWLKGKSFFKQSKVDPEWQNQLPVR